MKNGKGKNIAIIILSFLLGLSVISNSTSNNLLEEQKIVNTKPARQVNTSKVLSETDSQSVTIPTATMAPTPKPIPTPKPTPRPTPIITPKPYVPPLIVNRITNNSSYTCDCSKTCPNMISCEEAYYQLNTCGCSARDGDNDGVPCESICK